MDLNKLNQDAIIRGLEMKLQRQRMAVGITEQHIAVLKEIHKQQNPELPLDNKKGK